MAAGTRHTLVLLESGDILAAGENLEGQCAVPPLPIGVRYVAVGAGRKHSLAARSDGVIVGWGLSTIGQVATQVLPAGVTCVRVTGGDEHSLACWSDGSALAWGGNLQGQCDIPANPAGIGYIDVDAGAEHSLALRSDGIVVGFGANDVGRSQAPTTSSFVRVRAHGRTSVALRANGSLEYLGDTRSGQANVPAQPPERVFTEVEVSSHVLPRASDGSVQAWGPNLYGECDVPPLPQGVAYVEAAAGGAHTLLRRSDVPLRSAAMESSSHSEATTGASATCLPLPLAFGMSLRQPGCATALRCDATVASSLGATTSILNWSYQSFRRTRVS